jgi:predicted nucleic acid-binding protein
MSVLAREKVVIKDACILIDLLDLDLLAQFYELNLTVITRPEVLAEIQNQKDQILPYIESGKLVIDDDDELESALAIIETNRGLSITDATVLVTARRLEAVVLSSDKSLRNESNRQGLEVRGMLWILEELLNAAVLSLDEVLEKLRLYPEVNDRAPRSEIASLVNRLQEQAASNNAPKEN